MFYEVEGDIVIRIIVVINSGCADSNGDGVLIMIWIPYELPHQLPQINYEKTYHSAACFNLSDTIKKGDMALIILGLRAECL